jgi:DNA invertase Pin-like site-specific DNA recombinase
MSLKHLGTRICRRKALDVLHAAGVDLYLERQGVDTSTPAGRALFQMLGVFAEFERALIQERIRAGIANAKANGTRSGRPFGRPTIDHDRRSKIETLLGEGIGIRRVARMTAPGKRSGRTDQARDRGCSLILRQSRQERLGALIFWPSFAESL